MDLGQTLINSCLVVLQPNAFSDENVQSLTVGIHVGNIEEQCVCSIKGGNEVVRYSVFETVLSFLPF